MQKATCPAAFFTATLSAEYISGALLAPCRTSRAKALRTSPHLQPGDAASLPSLLPGAAAQLRRSEAQETEPLRELGELRLGSGWVAPAEGARRMHLSHLRLPSTVLKQS